MLLAMLLYCVLVMCIIGDFISSIVYYLTNTKTMFRIRPMSKLGTKL